MKISAVVPTYNDEDVIEECLNSLFYQTRKFDEIIVVDDGSTDNTLKIVKKFPVKIIQTEHRGRSHARNVGWRNATGEVIAFIESDSVYAKNWLEYCIKEIESGADAVSHRRQVYNPESFVSRMNDEVFKIRLVTNKYDPISAWVFRRDALLKLGGYDENISAAEDVDLGNRIKKNGYEIKYTQEAVEYHKGEPGSLEEHIKRSWWFGKNMLKFYEKYPAEFPYLKFLIFTLLTFLIFSPKPLIFGIAILYLFFILRVLYKGLSPKYVVVSPFLSLIGGWIFTIGTYYAFVKRILRSGSKS